jgi:hypothetical protein
MREGRKKTKQFRGSSISFLFLEKKKMKKYFRWIGYVALALLILFAIGYGVGQAYKPKLLATINGKLKAGINGDIQIGDLDFTFFNQFPNFSIVLSNVYIRGPRYEQYHRDFFNAKKIYVHVQLWHLLRGVISLESLSIEDASVSIFTTKDGYKNIDVFKKNGAPKKEKKESLVSLDIQKIRFKNTHIVVADSLKKKTYGLTFVSTDIAIDQSSTMAQISINGPIHFDGLTFNPEKGSYLLNLKPVVDLSLQINSLDKTLTVLPSKLQFEKSLVMLSGEVGGPTGKLYLKIHVDQLYYPEGLSIVTKALREKLNKFQFKKPVALDVLLDGLLTGGEPKVVVGFSAQKNQLTMNKLSIDDFSFAGSFMNHVDTTKAFEDPNSRVTLKSFSGRVEGVPMEGSLSITNLIDPFLALESKSNFSLTDLNSQTDTTKRKFLDGQVSSQISYQGPLKEYLDKSVTSFTGKLQGNVRVSNGALQLREQNKKIDQVKAIFQFTEKEMRMDSIFCRINGNAIQVNGMVRGFIPFFFQPEKKGYVNLSIYSPRLDLSTLQQKKVKTKRGIAKDSPKKKKVDELVHTLVEKVEFTIEVKVDQLTKGSFQADHISGKISLLNNQLKGEKLKVNTGGGTLQTSWQLDNLDKLMSHATLDVQIKDADIKKIFKSFDNFNQKKIRDENISGILNTQLKLSADVDDQFKIDTTTLRGTLDLKIKNGKIVNFEPLEKMSNFLFKKRDFEEVEFAEINSAIQMNKSFLEIDRMEVQSSVLSFFLEGRYSLGDSTDLSVQIPLSNLKKRDKTYQPENIGTDKKAGTSVYLHIYEKKGKIAIAYDPFKKHVGKQK